MEKYFNNILVPVNLWKEGGSIVEKAVEIAFRLQCQLHILHLVNKPGPEEESDFGELKAGIYELYKSRLPAPLYLTVSRQEGPTGKSIIEYYRKHKIDLILLVREKRSFFKWFSQPFPIDTDWLLKKIQCPVLNIPPASALPVIKNIVLPVGEALPIRKLLFATYLAKLSGSTIHMVSPAGKSNGLGREGKESLSGAFRLLRENTNLPVECQTLPGNNLADVAWFYARTIKADLILISPGKESLLPGSFSSLHSRWLFNSSRIPVLSVS